jgi:hypothetical protein
MSISPVLLLLFSLSIWLLSLFSLLLPPDADSSDSPLILTLGGADHRGISHSTPVNVLSLKEFFCHFLHGAPDRSNALRPALMAPWFAFGPSLCAAAVPVAAGPLRLFVVGSALTSSLLPCQRRYWLWYDNERSTHAEMNPSMEIVANEHMQ